MKFFMGIDLSLTNTGIVVLDNKAKFIKQLEISTLSKDVIEYRLLFIKEEIKNLLNEFSDFIIYIEGLSMASRGQGVLQLAALHYFIRVFLYQNEFVYHVVAPTSLKKFVCTGKAKKELMLKEVYKKWGFDTDNDNIADAYGLARMSLEEYIEKKD